MTDPQNSSAATQTARLLAARVGQAQAAYSQGKAADARRLCTEVLEAAPDTFEALHLLGIIEAQKRNFAAATPLLIRAADMAPNNAGLWANLANLLREQRRPDEALVRYDRVVELQPDNLAARINRGRTLKEMGRQEEALVDLDAAIALSPDIVDAHFQRGVVLRSLGRLEEALSSYDRTLELRPDFAAAITNRANVLRDLGRPAEALAGYDRAITANPGLMHAHIGRGALLTNMGRTEEAAEAYEAALTLIPDTPDGLLNRATVLGDLRRFDEALACCQALLADRPGDLPCTRQMGLVLAAMNRHDEAITCFDAFLLDRPDDMVSLINRGVALRHLQKPKAALADYDRVLAGQSTNRDALNNRANVLRDLGRARDAADAFALLLKHHPDYRRAIGKQLNTRLMSCDWTDFEDSVAVVTQAIREGDAADMPFAFLAYSTSPADQLACATAWIGEKSPEARTPLWTGERYRHDRIRLAYLSADFHYHPMAHLMGKLFETHDRDRFELTAISFGPDTADPMRKRLEGAFDHFIDVRNHSDQEAAELVRKLEIDIAVDRKGFTRNARTTIFAARPAPIQVNYLAYPGTMGAPYIDYLIADPMIIPEGDERFYSEKVVRLPDTYQATDDARPISEITPTRAECGLPEKGFVFCSFNNNYKILPPTFDIWMRLLRAVEGSVLWLFVKNEDAIANLRREAEARGVSADRLVFARYMTMSDHLARHKLADLFIDTFPYTAHTTASDALWGGLPVITCTGETFTSRVAAGLLSAVGLPELITSTFAEYEALALKLAREPALLAGIRAKLADRRTRWPLFNTDRFRAHLEAAYVTMYERHQQGLPPAAFDVPAIAPPPEA